MDKALRAHRHLVRCARKKIWDTHRRALAGLGTGTAAIGLGLLLAASATAAQNLSLTATNAVVGQTIQATAHLSEPPSAGGSISFEVFGPGDSACTIPEPTPALTPVPVGSEVEYPSGNFTAPSAGVYHWRARYADEFENPVVESECTAVSTVEKATPELQGNATSGALGATIHDEVTLAGGFSPTGNVTFSVFAPSDVGCATPLETQTVTVSPSGRATSPGFIPQEAGEFRWTSEYSGDGDNQKVVSPCGAPDQTSIIGTIAVNLAASASDGPVGSPLNATATIRTGAIPTGNLIFLAFSPRDANCSGAAAFSSAVRISGSGSYRSADFVPTGIGTFHWTVNYSGDPNHAPTSTGCGAATSRVSRASTSISGKVRRRLTVGAHLRDEATLLGGYAPTGTITFRIYGPAARGCIKPAFVDTVKVAGNGTFSSDPFVPPRPGRYSFVASYSGDGANQATSEPCDSKSQVIRVLKRAPKVKPRAQLIGRKRISIRARLSGGASPSGVISFRLYLPGDRKCRGKAAFGGGLRVKSNGIYSLAEYFATKSGVYHLVVGYSGDRRNKRYTAACAQAQPIRVG